MKLIANICIMYDSIPSLGHFVYAEWEEPIFHNEIIVNASINIEVIIYQTKLKKKFYISIFVDLKIQFIICIA